MYTTFTYKIDYQLYSLHFTAKKLAERENLKWLWNMVWIKKIDTSRNPLEEFWIFCGFLKENILHFSSYLVQMSTNLVEFGFK